ncbi:hypothetical protein [Candidatus Methylocalor cossyra]|uniref:Uncharacterized protein n=1 Tax=Candidatus Methylocalor cossyra TaxID=3108543 RepID=A0ABM9NMT4_9GAMM
MERIRILSLKSISQRQAVLIRQGQMEAARVWTACRDLHLQVRRDKTPWPNRDALQKATKARFALHSQSIQMVAHAFLAAVQATRENRRNGRAEIRYPYRDKRFFPLLWPAQAMGLEDTRIRRRLVRWCRFQRASRIYGRVPCGPCVVVAWTRAEVVSPNRGLKRRARSIGRGSPLGTAHTPRALARSSPASAG